jgi:hypothetical protein
MARRRLKTFDAANALAPIGKRSRHLLAKLIFDLTSSFSFA